MLGLLGALDPHKHKLNQCGGVLQDSGSAAISKDTADSDAGQTAGSLHVAPAHCEMRGLILRAAKLPDREFWVWKGIDPSPVFECWGYGRTCGSFTRNRWSEFRGFARVFVVYSGHRFREHERDIRRKLHRESNVAVWFVCLFVCLSPVDTSTSNILVVNVTGNGLSEFCCFVCLLPILFTDLFQWTPEKAIFVVNFIGNGQS